LAGAARQDFFFIVFSNYFLSSISVFIFLVSNPGSNRFVSSLRAPINSATSLVGIVAPVLALAGAAPSLGFLAKFMLVFNCWSADYLLVFSALSVTILFTVIFYFQIFKNLLSVNPRPRSAAASSYGLAAVLVAIVGVVGAGSGVSSVFIFYSILAAAGGASF